MNVDLDKLQGLGMGLTMEGLVRRDIRLKSRYCRFCGNTSMTDPIQVTVSEKYDDGRTRPGIYAFCNEDHRRAYESWDE